MHKNIRKAQTMITHKFIHKSKYNSEQKYLQVTYLVFSDVRPGLPLRSRTPSPSQLMLCRRNQTERKGCAVLPYENLEEDGADELRLWVE